MIYGQDVISLVSAYVTRLFKKYQTPRLVYHNLAHTVTVADKAQEIANNYSLTDSDLFILLSAAWFHDCGHLFGPAENHEERSATIMKAYMQTISVEDKIVIEIAQCILSTKMPTKPKSLLAAILCDADSYHLGTADFIITDELVKKELGARKLFLPLHWNESSLAFLESHQYFTEYCRNLLNGGKLKNIAFLKETIGKEK